MESRMVGLIPRVLRARTLSIESKMILLSLIVNSGEATSLRIWAIALRISDNTLKSALDDLLALECITKEHKKSSSPRGETKYFVQAQKTEKLLAPTITQGENKRSSLRGSIETFVKETLGQKLNTSRSEKDRKCELLPVNLILFAIFLVHSDELGIVDKLSKADLKKLTGYTADKLNSQLKKLVRIGVLSLRVSGLSKSLLVGKVKSIYFLNLTHDAFKCYEYELVQYKYVFLGMNRNVFLKSIGECEKSVTDKTVLNEFSGKALSNFFEKLRELFNEMTRGEASYIQAKSEHLITMFLYHERLDIPLAIDLSLEKKLQNWLNMRTNLFPKISFDTENVSDQSEDKENNGEAKLALVNIVITHAMIRFLTFLKTKKFEDMCDKESKLSSDTVWRFVQVNRAEANAKSSSSPFVKLEKYTCSPRTIN